MALKDCCKKLGNSSPLLPASVYLHLLFGVGLGAGLGTVAHREVSEGSSVARSQASRRGYGPWTGRNELVLEFAGGATSESDPIGLNSLGEFPLGAQRCKRCDLREPSCWEATPWEDSPGQDAGYSWGPLGGGQGLESLLAGWL